MICNDDEIKGFMNLVFKMRRAQDEYYILNDAVKKAQKVYADAQKAKLESNSMQHLASKLSDASDQAQAKLKEAKALQKRVDDEITRYSNRYRQYQKDKGYTIKQ